MPLDPKVAEAMRADSLDAAAAFLEDFDYIRDLVARGGPNRQDARRLSVILRRWLLEGDLHAVAAPRIGRPMIAGNDYSLAYLDAAIKKPQSFFAVGFTGGANILRVFFTIGDGTHSMDVGDKQLTIDQFRDQKIVFFQGMWLTRRELIRYVANEKSGVHSNQEDRIENKDIIARIEMSLEYTFDGKNHKIVALDAPSFAPRSTYKKNVTNPVLLEMYMTAADIVASPDIKSLAEYIRKELDEASRGTPHR